VLTRALSWLLLLLFVGWLLALAGAAFGLA
jgi:hypothetical protein